MSRVLDNQYGLDSGTMTECLVPQHVERGLRERRQCHHLMLFPCYCLSLVSARKKWERGYRWHHYVYCGSWLPVVWTKAMGIPWLPEEWLRRPAGWIADPSHHLQQGYRHTKMPERRWRNKELANAHARARKKSVSAAADDWVAPAESATTRLCR